VGPSGYILDYDRWARGILFPMEVGGLMCGICRVDEWADGHEYSIDRWAEVVEYNVYGCTKVDVNQIDEYAITLDGWAGCYMKYNIRWVG
jgi:hypothetical protein